MEYPQRIYTTKAFDGFFIVRTISILTPNTYNEKNIYLETQKGIIMKKILFIGNSHTYMNDMPELTRQMIENITGEECQVFMLAYSVRSLKWHMKEEYFSERFNILHGHYDYCIINRFNYYY